MRDIQGSCKVAVAQSRPQPFDRDACLAGALGAIHRVAEERPSDLVVLPELLIPGYPHGLTFGFVVGARESGSKELWKRYYDGSVVVGGPETEAIAAAARETGAWVSVGVSERDATSGTLYNTNLVFAPDGHLDTWHRKLKPTGAERLVWGDAQDHYFPVSQTPWAPWAPSSAGRTTCRWRVRRSTRRAWPSTLPPTPTATPNGRQRSSTSPLRVAALW